MYTVTSKIQADKLRHEINVKQYNLILVSNAYNTAAEAVNAMEEYCGDDKEALKELKDEPDYQKWHAAETTLDAKKDSLETEIKLMEEEMKNFEKGSQNGIKESTSFWCFGG